MKNADNNHYTPSAVTEQFISVEANELMDLRRDRFNADRLCEHLLNEVSKERLDLNVGQLRPIVEYARLRGLNIPF